MFTIVDALLVPWRSDTTEDRASYICAKRGGRFDQLDRVNVWRNAYFFAKSVQFGLLILRLWDLTLDGKVIACNV